MGQDIAIGTESRSASSAEGQSLLGAHAERLSTLVTAQRASVDKETGLALYRDSPLLRSSTGNCLEKLHCREPRGSRL